MNDHSLDAHRQWATRPADECFVSLDALYSDAVEQQKRSSAKVRNSREITFAPAGDDHKSLAVTGKSGTMFAPTNWAFGQMCSLVGAPAGWLRDRPAELVADELNYDYKVGEVKEIGLLLEQNGSSMVRAATGANYGRVWDSEFVGAVREHFGNGLDGRWHIPGEFNAKVSADTMTKKKTTLYRGDRDTWLFLCDGANDIEIPNRRNGKPGRMQRGFFAGNSEVGGGSLFGGFFGFDFICENHIVWGMQGFEEIRIRHTKGAPARWLEELLPVLKAYAESDTTNIRETIAKAQAAKLEEKVDEFLANRFGPRIVAKLKALHETEEGRPIETRWDAVTAATAYARAIPFIGDRVAMEREAGKILVAA